MQIARVIGTTVATIKDEKLYGRKLLILRQTDETGEPSGKYPESNVNPGRAFSSPWKARACPAAEAPPPPSSELPLQAAAPKKKSERSPYARWEDVMASSLAMGMPT